MEISTETSQQMIWRWITYYDFRTKYSEKETREILKEMFCCPEQIEEEIDIIYHRPDTDFSLNILSYTQQKYHEQMKELIEKYEKEHSLNNQDIDK